MRVTKRPLLLATITCGLVLAGLPAFGQRAAATRSGSGSGDSPSGTVSRSPSASPPSSTASSSGTTSGSRTSTSSRTAVRRSSGTTQSSSSASVSAGSSSSSSRQRALRSDWRHREPRYTPRPGYPYWGYWGWDNYWYGPSWSWGWWGWWGHTYYHPWGPRVVYVDRDADVRTVGGLAALDMDVEPEETEVWVDGGLVGTADDFDGFPSYLWLDEGEHEIVLYHPGRETLLRQVNLVAGELLRFDDQLRPGVSASPQELFTRFDNNAAAAVEREAEARELDPVEGSGRLRIQVSPADAAVWLDGRLIGSAADLMALRDALEVAAGSHEIVAVRPGWGELRRRIEVEAGEEVEISLDLTD